MRWITKGQCSSEDSCAFKHEPNKKGKEQGRLRSPSPTGSPHRSSKGSGKGRNDGGATGTPKLTGESPSGKANRLSLEISREEVAKGKTRATSRLAESCQIVRTTTIVGPFGVLFCVGPEQRS